MLGWSHKYDGVGLHICLTNKRSLGGPILREDVNLFITHPKVQQRRETDCSFDTFLHILLTNLT